MLSRIQMAARALFARKSVESEMEREMRAHIEMEMEENIRRGMSPDEARRVALVSFGGVDVQREAVRDERATRWLDDLATDLRLALRGMKKSPGFTAAVIGLVALGTGANTAIFSAINQTLLHPIPLADGDRMVEVRVSGSRGEFMLSPTVGMADAWRAKGHTIEDVLLTDNSSKALGDSTTFPVVPLKIEFVQPGVMRFVGTRPFRGREIIGSDTVASAPAVAMLGYGLWQKQFGSNDSIIGKTIRIDGEPHVVVGVMPKGFFLPFANDIDVLTAFRGGPSNRAANIVVKLRKGTSVDAALRELRTWVPSPPSEHGIIADPPTLLEGRDLIGGRDRRILIVLFGTVGLVLLIACANVANLMLSRAWSRQREFAVRRALGATRGRLARQVLSESLVLALFGGFAGVAVALVFQRLLIVWQPADDRILPASMNLDLAVLGWTGGIVLVTGILFGLGPALFASGNGAGDALKAGARSMTGSPASRRLRDALVVGEVAMSVVLLVGAGLLVRTLWSFQHTDQGFDRRNVAGIVIALHPKLYPEPAARQAALDAIRARISAVPGVKGTTLVSSIPPSFGIATGAVQIEGQAPSPDTLRNILYNSVSPDFFSFMKMRLIEGRVFSPNPALSDTVDVSEVMISEPLARRLFGDARSAIGRHVRVHGRTIWATIVGVVPDIGLNDERRSYQWYEPKWAAPIATGILIRSSLPPASLELPIRTAIRDVVPAAKIRGFVDIEARFRAGQSTQRFILSLIGCFAILALLLAGVGLQAVISYNVQLRWRELGIRLALGAPGTRIVRLIVRQGVILGGLGAIAGTVGALVASRSMKALLFGVQPNDPLTLATVCGLLMLVAVAAAMLPARYAARIDPVEMLRAD